MSIFRHYLEYEELQINILYSSKSKQHIMLVEKPDSSNPFNNNNHFTRNIFEKYD